MNKEILDLSIKLHITYAKALEEVDTFINKGLADSLEEAIALLILKFSNRA